jgi:hypothetical protein
MMTHLKAKKIPPAPFKFIDDEKLEIYEAIEIDDYVNVNLLTPEMRAEHRAMARATIN